MVAVLLTGIDYALSYPGSHARIGTTNMLESVYLRRRRGERMWWGFPQRGERGGVRDGDKLGEQRAADAEALPYDGRPRSSKKTKPTTCETSTYKVPLAHGNPGLFEGDVV
jgi:hypothetical protein